MRLSYSEVKRMLLLFLAVGMVAGCKKTETEKGGGEIYIPDPKAIYAHFDAITKIPRRSLKEDKMREYIISVANKYGHTYKIDKTGNLLVTVQATKNYENASTAVLQAHMDMVCVTDEDHKNFDFDKDPIQYYIEDGWMKARGTTLGADDGMGCAMMLTIMEDAKMVHPKLELLFTVDEEGLMSGAANLEASFLTGRTYINLDSETYETVYAGSAGSYIVTDAQLPFGTVSSLADYTFYKLHIHGLLGGHSGADIDKGLTNAIRLGGEFLGSINAKYGLVLGADLNKTEITGVLGDNFPINGGEAQNSIPKEMEAIIGVPAAKQVEIEAEFQKFAQENIAKIKPKEPNVAITMTPVAFQNKIVDKAKSDALIKFINEIPVGIIKMSSKVQGLVQTSNNLGYVHVADSKFIISTHVRSFVLADITEYTGRIKEFYAVLGAEVKAFTTFPPWDGDINTPLKKQVLRSFSTQTGLTADIKVIHAALECGYIAQLIPSMDIIAIGPLQLDVHTPRERVKLSTVDGTWKVLVDVLYNLAKK